MGRNVYARSAEKVGAPSTAAPFDRVKSKDEDSAKSHWRQVNGEMEKQRRPRTGTPTPQHRDPFLITATM
jgi:hypothetical protein